MSVVKFLELEKKKTCYPNIYVPQIYILKSLVLGNEALGHEKP
jgi:hypothetical protein